MEDVHYSMTMNILQASWSLYDGVNPWDLPLFLTISQPEKLCRI